MVNVLKARRAQIDLGGNLIDVFQMPDGSYRMSQTQVAEIVGLISRNTFDFFRSNAFKRLVGEGSRDSVFESKIIEIETDTSVVRSSRINAIPFKLVLIYWMWQVFRGNRLALALLIPLAEESLDRRSDQVFGITRSEAEYEQRLTASMQEIATLKQDLQTLGDAYAFDDLQAAENQELRREVQRLAARLEQYEPLSE